MIEASLQFSIFMNVTNYFLMKYLFLLLLPFVLNGQTASFDEIVSSEEFVENLCGKRFLLPENLVSNQVFHRQPCKTPSCDHEYHIEKIL